MTLPNGKGAFVDLYAGVGGLSFGFIKAGLKCICAVDSWATAQRNFTAHWPKVPFLLQDLSREEGISVVCAFVTKVLHGNELDLLLGGPPCQGQAATGGSGNGDARYRLVDRYLDAVVRLLPRVFVMETVADTSPAANPLTGLRLDARYQDTVRRRYALSSVALNPAECGTVQTQQRPFLIGVRADQPFSDLSVEFALAGRPRPPPQRTLRDAVQDSSRTRTVRECARIQGFPNDFRFLGSRADRYRLVEDAVSPTVSCVLADALCPLLGVPHKCPVSSSG